jgi:hypothetical protein
MKTSLAITAAALMLSAIWGLTSGVATAGFDGYWKSPGRCGVVSCPSQQKTPTSSMTYRGR